MKHLKLVLFLCGCALLTACDDHNTLQIDENLSTTDSTLAESFNVYDFSNVDFKNCKNWAERYAVCQIPEDILKNMSSADLAATSVYFPLYIVYLAFDDIQKGISEIIENFNGLQELIHRPDGAFYLLKAYERMRYTKEEQEKQTLEQCHSTLRFEYVELLLIDERFFSKFTDEELKLLEKVSLKQYQAKSRESDFGLLSKKVSLLVNATVRLNSRSTLTTAQRQQLEYFVEHYFFMESKEMEPIIEILTD